VLTASRSTPWSVHNAVQAAIRRGDLVRPGQCDDCGAGGPVEGHHDDYSKPLAVRWLCTSCHRRADTARRRSGRPGLPPRIGSRVVSLSDRERARLTRLAELRGSKPSRVLADAVTHMLATLELNEPVHYVVPSEQAERER
jgi:hypothetical protein